MIIARVLTSESRSGSYSGAPVVLLCSSVIRVCRESASS
eukprot:COSAG06_NODE_29752_length_550_cov_8.884701_2_plen_38_part_01